MYSLAAPPQGGQSRKFVMPGSGLLRSLPFIGIAVAVYLVGTMLLALPLDSVLFSLQLPSGAPFRFQFSDLVLLLGLALFFVELLLSTRPTQASLVNHALSMALFVLCGVLFLLVAKCGTATFFLLTLLTLIDVVSGYSISIIAARRDLTFEKQM
jgi:hypothetical protein